MDRHHTVQVSEMPYGIGMKPEYDMKPENELKHEHEHEKPYVMNTECDKDRLSVLKDI